MCQNIDMMGGSDKDIVAVRHGFAITRVEKDKHEQPIPDSSCLCHISDTEILHLIVDNLEGIDGETPIKALMAKRP